MWEFKDRVRVSLLVGLSNLAFFCTVLVIRFLNYYFAVGSHGRKSLLGSVLPFGGSTVMLVILAYWLLAPVSGNQDENAVFVFVEQPLPVGSPPPKSKNKNNWMRWLFPVSKIVIQKLY
jgi:hypothetical protein